MKICGNSGKGERKRARKEKKVKEEEKHNKLSTFISPHRTV